MLGGRSFQYACPNNYQQQPVPSAVHKVIDYDSDAADPILDWWSQYFWLIMVIIAQYHVWNTIPVG